MTNEIELPKIKNDNWIYLLAIVCGSIIVYGLTGSKNVISDIPYLLGQNLVLALILAGLIRLIFKNTSSNKPNTAVAFALLLISLMISDLLSANKNNNDLKKFAATTKSGLNEVLSKSYDEQGMPQLIDKKFDESSNATSQEVGVMEVFMNKMFNKIIKIKNDYLLEMQAIGWMSILDPDRVAQDQAFLQSKTIIKNAKELVSKYRAKHLGLFDENKSEIMKLDLTEKQKSEFLAGYNSALERGIGNVKSQWDLEEKVLLEFENIIEFLSATNGTWEVQNGQFLFSTDEDVNTFNSFMTNIDSITEEQTNLQQQAANNVNNKLDKIIEK